MFGPPLKPRHSPRKYEVRAACIPRPSTARVDHSPRIFDYQKPDNNKKILERMKLEN